MPQSARSRRRAERAIIEGRTPGRPGPKSKYTEEERKAVLSARDKAYREKNKETLTAKRKAAYDLRHSIAVSTPKKRGRPLKYRTPEELRASEQAKTLRFRTRNAEKCRAQVQAARRRRKEETPEAYAASKRRDQHIRRARKAAVDGSYTAADIAHLFKLQKGKCVLCLKPLIKTKFHVDHHVPLAKGGTNDRSNLRLLHTKCNLSKGARDPAEHALRNGLLCW